MTVDREDTSDLQLLIEILQIDTELISVDIIKANQGLGQFKDEGKPDVTATNDNNTRIIHENVQDTEEKAQVDSSKIRSSEISLSDGNNKTPCSIDNLPSSSNSGTKESLEGEGSSKIKSEGNVETPINVRKRKASEETTSTDNLNVTQSNDDVKVAKVSE